MKSAIWLEEYRVSSFLVDFHNQLSLHALLGFMQETAWRHASHLGHGYQEVQQRGVAWVLFRQRIEMAGWPLWGERLMVRTWLRPPGPVIITRDFEFLVGERQVGRAAAHWITINERSRKPVALEFPDHPGQFRADGHLPWEPSRIGPREGLETLADFEVRLSELDMNLHANNTYFGQWIMDAISLPEHQSHVLTGYEVNFLAEARPGDKVAVQRAPLSALIPGGPIPFQGRRLTDGKVVFAANLTAAARSRG